MAIKNEHGYVSGWLSPKGVFTPCEYGHHLDTAEEVLFVSEERNQAYQHIFEERVLELTGYIKIVGHHYQQNSNYLCFPEQFAEPNKRTTKHQIGWLLDHFEELSEGQKEYVATHLREYA